MGIFAHLTALPQEILEHVLAYLDAISLVKCIRVCKRLSDAIRESDFLQYTIELRVANYVDYPKYPGGAREKRELLAKQLSYWNEMKWTQITLAQRGFGTRNPDYKIQTNRTVFGGVAGDETEREMEAIEIRPWFPRKKPRRHQVTLPGPRSDVLCIAPDHNLLAMLVKTITQIEGSEQEEERVCCKLFDLTTCLPHPRAKNHELLLQADVSWQEASILGRMIIITPRGSFARERGYPIMIYDWRTGSLIQEVWSSERFISSFKLVSETHYVILVSRNATKEELDLACSENSQSEGHSDDDCSRENHNLSGKPGPRGAMSQYAIQLCHLESNEVIAKFHLPYFPEFWQGCFVYSPNEEVAMPGDDSFMPSEAPFGTRPEPVLYFVQLLFTYGGFGGSRTAFSFITFISSLFPNPVGHRPGTEVPWDAWGNEKARCISRKDDFRYHHETVSGYRVLDAEMIRDFNPLAVSRDLSQNKYDGIILECESDDLHQCEMVERNVYRSLGGLDYRVIKHHIPTNDMGTQLAEHALVGLRTLTTDVFV